MPITPLAAAWLANPRGRIHKHIEFPTMTVSTSRGTDEVDSQYSLPEDGVAMPPPLL